MIVGRSFLFQNWAIFVKVAEIVIEKEVRRKELRLSSCRRARWIVFCVCDMLREAGKIYWEYLFVSPRVGKGSSARCRVRRSFALTWRRARYRKEVDGNQSLFLLLELKEIPCRLRFKTLTTSLCLMSIRRPSSIRLSLSPSSSPPSSSSIGSLRPHSFVWSR